MTQAECEAVIYARSSAGEVTDPQDILAKQINECVKYAHQHSIVIAETFVDLASGSLKHRPGLRNLMEYLGSRSPAVASVITVEKSRVARSIHDYIEVCEEIADLGAVIIIVNEKGAEPSYI